MKTEIEVVKELMSKYGLTAKDLFSFCICAVNFLEYYHEECMGDMMMGCPERYFCTNSDNTRAVAGALNGEKKAEGWTDEDQFAYYMRNIQDDIVSLDGATEPDELFGHLFDELQRFERVYKREIMIPILLGCPVEKYDDSRFDDKDYIRSIINKDNLTVYNTHKAIKDAEYKKFREKEEAELKKEIEKRKSDKDFSVLLGACTEVNMLKDAFDEYNKKYYPDRDYKVVPLHRPELMVIQTGGESIEKVKEHILNTLKQRIMIMGYVPREELLPIDKVFKDVPKNLSDLKVTHAVTYF